MKNTLLTYIDRYRHNRHDRLVLGSVLLFLALFVVVFVYWQLRYVGVTMTNETYCGYDEHVHTEECYEYVLVCGSDETDGHTHDESCYDEEENLICGLEECEPHSHTDECYELQLTCGYEEHAHTVDCLINLEADLEDATVWEATIPMLSGDLRTDIVTVAYSQLGYTESTTNYAVGEDGLTHYGYTRYGAWYGNSYSDWDSMFVSFCLDYAGISDEFSYNAGAYAWTIDLTNLGYYQTADVYSPSVGDVVFIDTDLDGKANVTAIVAAIDESVITVIQGNYDDSVAIATYTLDDSILGYANVTYTGEEETEAEEDEEIIIGEVEEEVSEELTTLTYEGIDYTITVSYGEDAGLPDGTELVAYEYAQDSETFLSRYEEASALYGWEDTDSDTYHGFRLFNIGLYYDGAEIEPSASVTVTVTYTGETDDTSTTVSVTHFSDTDTETLDATLTENNDSQSVTFASDTFSDFGIALASEEEEETNTLTASSSDTLEAVTITDSVIGSLDGLSFVITSYTGNYAVKAEISGTALSKDAISSTAVIDLTQWTFTSDGNGGYYISSGDNYLVLSYSSSTTGIYSFTSSKEDATAFTVSTYTYTDGVTYIAISGTVNSTTYYMNQSNGDGGTTFVAWYNSPKNGGTNAMLSLYTVSDPYDDYTSVSEFTLTIYDSDDQKNSIYSETITDVWTDGTYYYIPISYFEDELGTDEYPYSFDSTSTVTCPFMYAPDGSKLMGTMSGSNYPNVTSCYYAFYAQIGDDWYLKVTDTTTGGTTPRANVYYCPTFEYYFYIGSVNSSSVTGSGTDHENYGEEIITDFAGYENYTLIPIKYFSDHIVESSLTATDTLTINGESYGYCTATDFTYKTRRWSADVATPVFVYYSDAWYLRVQDNSVGYTLPRIGIIGYTGNVGVYTTEDEFYLWIYDELERVYSNATWVSGTTYDVNPSITDVLSYTDPDSGKTYYYIPVSYFELALSSLGYDSTDILSRSLLYAPDANATLSNSTSNITTCLFADYEEIDGELYVRVTDTTTNSDPHRVNVYFCPEYVYNIYVGTDSKDTDSVEEVTISEYIGLGDKYVLIPVSNFDNFFDESSLDASTMATVTDDFTGYELTLYESPFQYKADWSGSTVSDAYYYYSDGSWYLLVQYDCDDYAMPLRNKIWYTASVSGVVINLTNGNGSAEFTHYGQNAMRYTVDLTDFADSDGNVTITLPSESDLNSTFVVAQNSTDSVSIELGSESAYDYKLVGWFNIATGEYYDVSGGSVTVTVDIDDYYNVFYADWIADSYDFVEDTGAANIIETADTSSFVTIQLFDFNELFNLYSESLVQNSLTSETWTDSGEFYSEPLLAKDATALTSLGKSFIFFDTAAPGNTTGRLPLPAGRKDWSFWTGNAAYKDEDWYNSAYPDLYNSDIIDMLYSTDGSALGSYYIGEANYLFTYDSTTGFYEYDAAVNAAVYQQSDERFYVYNAPQTYDNSSSSTIFLPFNSYSSSNSTYTSSNGEINYWFGVKIDLTFYLPNDTGVGGNLINGEEMIFEFKGDDDVWVFVDDELVLDLGGIHSAIDGTINFSTGEVTIIDAANNSTTTSFSTVKAGTHTLTFYYMERGAGASNMKITLNTIPSWKYETSTVGTMEVEKVWVDNNDADGLRPDSIVVGLFERADTYSTYVSSNLLVYVYNDVTYEIDDDGYSYDSDGYVNAYISSGYIYVRVDTVTLSDSNDWSYLWKLLDSEKSEHYQILELSTYSYYTTTSSHETLTEYKTYWSVEGDSTLNGDVTVDTETETVTSWTGILADGLKIVLTDGAQNGTADASDFPTTYDGYAIYVKDDGTIGTVKIDFSQAAEEETQNSGVYIYGVTVDVPDEAIWTVEMTGGYDKFTKDQKPSMFRHSI